MKLKKLIKNLDIISIKNFKNYDIKSITHISDDVDNSSMFICLKGNNFDGNDFVENAIQKETSAKSIEEIRTSMLEAFKGVAEWITEADFETVCGKAFDKLGTTDIVKLRNLYNAIKDGFVKAETAFKKEEKLQIGNEKDAEALASVNNIVGGEK